LSLHQANATERGRKELQRWLCEGPTPKVERNELLLKLFFGEEVSLATNISHIERYRDLQRGLLKRYKAIEKEIKVEYADNSNLPYWVLTVRYGQHVSQALIDWCDESLAKLKKLAKSGR
jgi:hypothetical protein